MAKVTGVGGFFIKTDKAATTAWLNEHLEMGIEPYGKVFNWLERDGKTKGQTVLGLFEKDSDYFSGSSRDMMLNLRVDDLAEVLAKLASKGVLPLKQLEEANGRFAHVPGPDGLTIELWEPVENDPFDP